MENKTLASCIVKPYDLNAFDIVSRAVDLYSSRSEFAYFYGAKGVVLTDEVMFDLMTAEQSYFAQYTPDEMQHIIDFSRGKIGIDCSGFINLLTGRVNWSTGYWEEAEKKTTPAAGTWGNILYTTFGGAGRHIGVDIGEGRFLHAPKEGRTIELGKIRDYPWEGSGQIKGVSYFLSGNR